jgi:CRISPR/Cas system CMR-associated protein Cmr5 small subunit
LERKRKKMRRNYLGEKVENARILSSKRKNWKNTEGNHQNKWVPEGKIMKDDDISPAKSAGNETFLSFW